MEQREAALDAWYSARASSGNEPEVQRIARVREMADPAHSFVAVECGGDTLGMALAEPPAVGHTHGMDLGVAKEAAGSSIWEELAEAAGALVEMDEGQALSVVDDLLSDSDLGVVRAAAESLLQRGDVRSASRFTKAYAKADDQIGDHKNDVLGPATVSQPRIVVSLRTLVGRRRCWRE